MNSSPWLAPANLPHWLHWLPQCPSTNTWALEHAASLQAGDAVFTPQQTAGRGQWGRCWQSPPGVLTVSFVLDVPAAQVPGLSLGVGLAVIYAITALVPVLDPVLQIKWPNDIWGQQRKLAGILCETWEEKSLGVFPHRRVIVGIGLNRQVDFALEEAIALDDPLSLHQLVPSVPSELALLTQLRHYLRQLASVLGYAETRGQQGLTALLPELNRRDALKHQVVTVKLGNQCWTGKALGLDAEGRLRVQDQSQVCHALASGSVQCLKRRIAIPPSRCPAPAPAPPVP